MHEDSCADFKDRYFPHRYSPWYSERTASHRRCWLREGTAVWYFRCGENFRRVLENARTDDERDNERNRTSVFPLPDTFVTRPLPRFITRFADVVSPTRTTNETNENEERPSLAGDVACMYEESSEKRVNSASQRWLPINRRLMKPYSIY